ncbi:MAG: hypothetical protein U0941_18995 [Planctomycetaceae bacterium]
MLSVRVLCCGLALPVLMCTAVYVSNGAEECPKEICNAGQKCNEILQFCSAEQKDKDCNGCDGTTVFRLCTKSVQDRECTKKTAATTCGEKFTGTCKEATFGYFYCKKTAAGGTHSCDKIECESDKACKPKS